MSGDNRTAIARNGRGPTARPVRGEGRTCATPSWSALPERSWPPKNTVPDQTGATTPAWQHRHGITDMASPTAQGGPV